MKKIIMTSMISVSTMIFIGCGSSSNSNGVKQDANQTVQADVNQTVQADINQTVQEDVNKTVLPEEIVGTTIIGNVRFSNLDNTATKMIFEDAVKYCEALDGDNSWRLPTRDELLLLLSDDSNGSKIINESVIPIITPDPDKPTETTHSSAIWSGTISSGGKDVDYRDVLYLGSKTIINQDIVNMPQDGNMPAYYTVCAKDVNVSN